MVSLLDAEKVVRSVDVATKWSCGRFDEKK
jgi:hypothetical protein